MRLSLSLIIIPLIVESIELDDITMVGLVKLLLLWYLQTNQNLKNYLLVLAKNISIINISIIEIFGIVKTLFAIKKALII
ncbi:hypothetical protein Kyoto4A_08890 [Helicobacter pylori]